MKKLIEEIQSCDLCHQHLPLGPRPVFTADPESKIVLIGQAPGVKVHRSGIPWDDQSGDNLRAWLEMDKTAFYNPENIALLPMGFCYPGKGKSGDLPPRKECAPRWHQSLMSKMKKVELIILAGKYAQDYYLGNNTKRNLTETVRHYEEYLPDYFVLPHPSPRNNIWMKKNPWFKKEVLPALKERIEAI